MSDGTVTRAGGRERERTRGTATYRTLVYVVARKRAMLLYRYPVNTLSRLVTVFVFFALIFFGGRALSARALDDSLGGIVVGFFLYTLAITAFSGLAWSVTRESQWGTLEQLVMSPFGFGRVMVATVLVRVAEGFCWSAVTLAFMLALTGATLHVPVLTVVVVGTLAVAPAVGLGFLFGGLALVYKRVENVFQLVNFGLVALVAAPTSGLSWVRLLPLAQGSHLLSVAMRDGRRLWELPAGELTLLAVAAVCYLLAGYAVFHRACAVARRRGLMGHY